jgi:RNA polymerase sigma factor (sigma-70 family)
LVTAVETGHSITTWIGQLRVGNKAAAAQLWERYFSRLVKYARRKLRGTTLRTADEEDVALSAFHSLCQRADRFPRLECRDDLWQLLVMLTARKTYQERRRQQSLKRGGIRTDDGPRCAQTDAPADQQLDEIIGAEPSPEFAIMVDEQFHALLERLPDDDLRLIARMRLEDYTSSEIAEKLQCSVRTVERKLSLIRTAWEESLPD